MLKMIAAVPLYEELHFAFPVLKWWDFYVPQKIPGVLSNLVFQGTNKLSTAFQQTRQYRGKQKNHQNP
jgi:hypothetical protein